MPQYLPLGVVNTPALWTLPANLELSVGAVFAKFDGTSAAGSFIPTLEIVSDAGVTVLEIPQDASVAAGSSVVASWAPFLRSQTASASSALTVTDGITFVSPVTEIDFTSGATVTDGLNGIADVAITSSYSPLSRQENVVSASTSCPGGVTTTSLSLAHSSGDLILSYTAPTQPKVTANGVYTFTATVVMTSTAATQNLWALVMTVVQATLGTHAFSQFVYSPTLGDATQGSISWTGVCLTGDSLRVAVTNHDTGALNFTCSNLTATRIIAL